MSNPVCVGQNVRTFGGSAAAQSTCAETALRQRYLQGHGLTCGVNRVCPGSFHKWKIATWIWTSSACHY